ncbi:MAG: hypothetical protein AUJ52_08070 [Elusimicrobia bacterium CG1_02_63_36]|nr:MAG: hypothetical protein AUJ52_08070 [Elusimicrobia bacterium CG1_02_63_36]
MTAWYGEQSRAVAQTVYFNPPNQWRHEVLDAGGNITRVTLQVGAKEWVLEAAADRIIERDVRDLHGGSVARETLRELLAQNFSVARLHPKTIAGRPAEGLLFSPVSNEGPRKTIWIDRETGIVLRRRQTNHRGKQIRESSITTLTLNPEFDKALFDPAALKGGPPIPAPERPILESADALVEAGFPKSFWVPELDYGFRLDAVRRLPMRSEQLLHARYVNGLSVLSLFVSPLPIDPHSIPTVESDDEEIDFTASAWAGNVLSFACGNKRHCVIIGDLSAKALTKLSRRFP